MTYDFLFLPKPVDVSWDEVLRGHDARIGAATALEAISGHMEGRFDAVVRAIQLEDPAAVRVEGPGFVELHEAGSGMQLHMFASEVSLGVRLTGERDEARAAADRMVRVARIVEFETGFRGFDPQIHVDVLGLIDPVVRVADEIVRIARRIDSLVERPHFRPSWRRWPSESPRR